MRRLLEAFRNSLRAAAHLGRYETAIRQEFVLLVISLPVSAWLAPDWPGAALLVGSLLVLILVEVLNTAVEAACNAVTRDYSPDIQLAKDCGSLAVLIAIVIAAGVWGLAVWEKFAGTL